MNKLLALSLLTLSTVAAGFTGSQPIFDGSSTNITELKIRMGEGETFYGDGFIVQNNGPAHTVSIKLNPAGFIPGVPKAFAKAFPARGKAHSNVYMTGQESAYLSNTSSSQQTYRVEVNIMTNDGSSQRGGDTFWLDPGRTMQPVYNSYLSKLFNYAGLYSLCSSAVITGSGNTSARDCQNVTILP